MDLTGDKLGELLEVVLSVRPRVTRIEGGWEITEPLAHAVTLTATESEEEYLVRCVQDLADESNKNDVKAAQFAANAANLGGQARALVRLASLDGRLSLRTEQMVYGNGCAKDIPKAVSSVLDTTDLFLAKLALWRSLVKTVDLDVVFRETMQKYFPEGIPAESDEAETDDEM